MCRGIQSGYEALNLEKGSFVNNDNLDAMLREYTGDVTFSIGDPRRRQL